MIPILFSKFSKIQNQSYLFWGPNSNYVFKILITQQTTQKTIFVVKSMKKAPLFVGPTRTILNLWYFCSTEIKQDWDNSMLRPIFTDTS